MKKPGTQANMEKIQFAIQDAILRFYTFLIGYRFKRALNDRVIPEHYKESPDNATIRAKATASLASVAIFLGLAVASLAAIIAANDHLREAVKGGWRTSAIGAVVVLTLYFNVRQERVLSSEYQEKKARDYPLLWLLLLSNSVLLLIWPLACRENSQLLFCEELAPSKFPHAMALAGLAMIVASVLFQVFAAEFYDSAAGWRGGEKEGGRTLRFHLASLASHSFLIGIGLAILGVMLLLSYINVWIASVASLGSLYAIIGLTEIERALWHGHPTSSGIDHPASSAEDRRETAACEPAQTGS
jgi:hypothetical protein